MVVVCMGARGSLPVSAQDFIEQVHILAEQGDAEAQAALGRLYGTGTGAEQDYVEALRWFRRAAAQGVADAEYALGVWYVDGRGGLEPDDMEALRWFRRAAAQRVADAQNVLGYWYLNGRGGLEQSDEDAVRWFREAADQDLPGAQVQLGLAYEMGRGVEPDDVEALRWFRRAATQRDVERPLRWFRSDLITVADGREHLERVANRRSMGTGRWYDAEGEQRIRITAEQGAAKAQYQLGDMYRRGVGLKRNYAEALHWYREAAEQGLADGYYGLGLLAHGRGDLEEALRWYREVAEQGVAYGQYEVAHMLADVWEGDRRSNDAEAARLYHAAAEQGFAKAYCNLAGMYEYGLGVEQDDAEAARWQRLCDAEVDDYPWWWSDTPGGRPLDEYEMAARYEYGVGVEQDDAEAIRWYGMAAEQEHLISELAQSAVERLEK